MSLPDEIASSGLTIYDSVPANRPDLFISAEQLEQLLEGALLGKNYGNMALRTRSKAVNQDICRALGYPIPKSFIKTKPRFPGQNFDKYVQKANNLQVWNDELDPTRRYVIIRQANDGTVSRVRVITGADLGLLDTTGTLTQKYQARLDPKVGIKLELISSTDTAALLPLFSKGRVREQRPSNPTDHPTAGGLLPIKDVFDMLKNLIGQQFRDAGYDQERNRGADLHRIVCQSLGYDNYADNGRFPDIRNQLLEVKLQTSPTIDLGLVLPSSELTLDGTIIDGVSIRHCDVRYALFHATTDGKLVTIDHLYLTTGKDFFKRFPQFEGRKLNKKLQIPLPSSLFNR